MSNILTRREPAGTTPTRREFDPFRFMADFMKLDPFRELEPTFVYDEKIAFRPAFEVKETKEAFTFKADLPGVAEKDLEVSLDGNRLVIAGHRMAEHDEKGETFFVYERSYGSFTRAFTLPDGADFEHVTSRLDAGVLTIVVPKKPEVQPKKIAVKVESKDKA